VRICVYLWTSLCAATTSLPVDLESTDGTEVTEKASAPIGEDLCLSVDHHCAPRDSFPVDLESTDGTEATEKASGPNRCGSVLSVDVTVRRDDFTSSGFRIHRWHRGHRESIRIQSVRICVICGRHCAPRDSFPVDLESTDSTEATEKASGPQSVWICVYLWIVHGESTYGGS